MSTAWQLTIGPDNIGRLIFDLPGEKVNKLSMPVLEELERVLDGLAQQKLLALVIGSGKEDIFIAGADIHSFEEVFRDPAKKETMIHLGHRVFNKLSALPYPTIAVIDGACVGGGLELALACTYRVATDNPKTSIGLPEVMLGIFPGWGGTQRLPRLVGLMEGLNMILTGKTVKAQKAFKIHLVDALIAKEFKPEKAAEFVVACLTPQENKKILERRRLHGFQHLLLEANPIGRAFVFWQAKKKLLEKTKGHYPAPLAALEVVRESAGKPLQEGLNIEIASFLKHLDNKQSWEIAHNLISIFFTQEALKKDPGAKVLEKPKPIGSIGVLGAGIMGGGISWLLSYHDHPVRMKEIDLQALGKGYGSIRSVYDQYVKDKRLKPYEASMKFQHISGTTNLTGFQNADLVIEAATENFELKQKLFAEVEEVMRPEAILATNTSSLSVKSLSQGLKHPERFLGLHFFNPVPRMPLVEVAPSEKTNPEAVVALVELCKKLGKTPIVVGDCPGFLVNRILTLGANELLRLYEEGADFDRLEKLMLNFGYPMGPFTLADEIGIDVMAKVSKVLEQAYGPRMVAPKLLDQLYEKKLYGKKVGKGFFLYKGKKKERNPEIEKMRGEVKPLHISDMEMSDRVFLSMINEASRCLAEKIATRPDYLDMALILGTGFPPFRGGLLRYADTLGIPYVVDQLKLLTDKYGERFTPSPYLLEMQSGNKTFYNN